MSLRHFFLAGVVVTAAFALFALFVAVESTAPPAAELPLLAALPVPESLADPLGPALPVGPVGPEVSATASTATSAASVGTTTALPDPEPVADPEPEPEPPPGGAGFLHALTAATSTIAMMIFFMELSRSRIATGCNFRALGRATGYCGVGPP